MFVSIFWIVGIIFNVSLTAVLIYWLLKNRAKKKDGEED